MPAVFTAEDGWEAEFDIELNTNDPVAVAGFLLTAHLHAFKVRKGLDRVDHFKQVAQAIWYEGTKPFIWHPWADRMLEAACCNKYLGVAGCGSSGKTEFFALWVIINFLCAPAETLVLVTTTTKSDADQRIWGAIKQLWQAMDPGLQCLGKMVGSLRCIRYHDPYTGLIDEKAGVYVVAGEKLSQKEASSKFIGKKQNRLILICDELPELSEALMEAAFSNLSLNRGFQMVGLGNPKSYFDPFGILAKPKNGWQSISVEDEGWETEKGYCLHFDGMKSPNIGHDEPIYPFLFKQSDLDDAINHHHGTKSPGFYRMVRGFWCPTGEQDCVYCEADIIKFRAEAPVVWATPPERVTSMDPAFTNGGDDSIATIIEIGISAETLLRTVCLVSQQDLVSDVTKKDDPHAYQIVRQWKGIGDKNNVDPKHAGYDSTGGGIPFGDIVSREWSPRVLAVNFGGAPTDRPVSAFNNAPANERYADKVTEIWFSAQEYIRSGQIRGLTIPLIKEMCSRKYETVKKNGVSMPCVESKIDMKLRTKQSPDKADSFFISLMTCIERLAFGRVAKPSETARPSSYHRPVRRGGVLPKYFLSR